MSHRYGFRSLPERVIAQEYELLRNQLENFKHEIDLSFKYNKEENASLDIENIFEFCYELDGNENPARYRLKHLEKVFSNYNQKVCFHLKSLIYLATFLTQSILFKDPVFEKVWNKIELKLGNVLRKIAEKCYELKLINQTQYERFFVSGKVSNQN